MKNIQNLKPKNQIKIDEVGVKDILVPLVVEDRKHKCQQTVGAVSIFVDLPSQYRGTHMSRFVEILNKYIKHVLSIEKLDELILEVIKALEAERGRLAIRFPYFLTKQSPVSKKKSLLDYSCKIVRLAIKGQKRVERIVEIRVPIMTVCPCSRAISRFGAHNQRGYVEVRVKTNKFIWIEELIKIVEEEASCEIFSLLKKTDEKFITEKSYDNPKFVEDVVRDIAVRLQDDERIDWFEVECDNQESIHNHNAYARVESEPRFRYR